MKTLRLILFVFGALQFGLLPNASRAADTKRPNILFAFADDWGRYASIYAQTDGPGGINDVVRTPNFDRLAQRGVLFTNAFVNAPSCTPCRSSLLSGQYFWRTGRGAILQGAVWDSAIPTYPLLLGNSGYHLGKSYKVWSPGTPSDSPYGGQKYSYQQAGGRVNQFSQNVTKLVAGGKSVDEAKQEIYNEVRDNFRAMLAKRGEDQPFCYWFGPTNVHRQWVRGSGKQLWGFDPDSLEGKMPPFLPDVPVVREDLVDYFGEIAAFDTSLGIMLDELEQVGELDNTLVVVSGDHGAPGFPHGKCNLYDFGTAVALAIAGPGVKGGRVVDDFTILPDLAPTFLEAGGVEIPEQMTARSLWPVLASEKSGQVDPQRTAAFFGRERHVEMARAGHLPYPQRSIRTADYSFIINFRPDRYPLGDPYNLGEDDEPGFDEIARTTFVTLPDEDAGPTKAWMVEHHADPAIRTAWQLGFEKRPARELYICSKDPFQMENVAGQPAYAELEERLVNQLLKELRATDDPRVTEHPPRFERAPFTD
ncbi:MAG: sulfatase [Planctomycetales bacterium]|nr:sulfatase [Planctomycetales bacterium]